MTILRVPTNALFCNVSAASTSYADVSAAVAAATDGQTVCVPAGLSNWGGSKLSITKRIRLHGAGIGSTVITSPNPISFDPSSNYSSTSLFRIDNFTFDHGNAAGLGVEISCGNTTIVQQNIRIDHCRFQNIPLGSSGDHYLYFYGDPRGCIDSNQFAKCFYPVRFPTADPNDGGLSSWDAHEGVNLSGYGSDGTQNNMWFEDNVFEELTDAGGVIVTDCQEGARYAFRFNTITIDQGGQPLFDQHGNDGFQAYSSQGGIIYGNRIIGPSGLFYDQRGGRSFCMWNSFSSTGWSTRVRDEVDESWPPLVGTYTGPGTRYSMDVNGTYHFGNIMDGGTYCACGNGPNSIGGDDSKHTYNPPGTVQTDKPLAGRDYFTDDGSTSPAVTYGTLGSRPGTCSVGQGYWATTQSTTVLSGMVGATPANPISGTLYICTSTNVWDSGTAPIAYPHPLRNL